MARHKLANNGQLYEAAVFPVEGNGVFPLDMLRYDACWPYTESQDSTALGGAWHDAKLRRVVLQTNSPTAPTEGRWKSFGWRVVALKEDRKNG